MPRSIVLLSRCNSGAGDRTCSRVRCTLGSEAVATCHTAVGFSLDESVSVESILVALASSSLAFIIHPLKRRQGSCVTGCRIVKKYLRFRAVASTVTGKKSECWPALPAASRRRRTAASAPCACTPRAHAHASPRTTATSHGAERRPACSGCQPACPAPAHQPGCASLAARISVSTCALHACRRYVAG